MTLNSLPEIKLQSSPELESGLFVKFLHHDFHPQHKNMIFKSFPELKEKTENATKEEEDLVIKEFISDFYKTHDKQIKSIVSTDAELLKEKGKSIIESLTNLMDADWSGTDIITAVPTILPFSPFEKKAFFYSILERIRGNLSRGNILFIAAHEISHFVFYDTIEKLPEDKKGLSKETTYYLKEALASAVLNEQPLKNILNLNDYLGNPELKNLTVSIEKKEMSFVKFISAYYHNHKINEGKVFKDVLASLIDILSKVDKDLIAKHKLWNQHGLEMEKNIDALRDYSSLIEIKSVFKAFF